MAETPNAIDRVDAMQKRKAALQVERSSFISHWRDLSSFVQPRLGRFFLSDRNRGDKRYQNIVNSRATMSHRAARAGLFAGTMSPARPWFNLQTADPDMLSYQPIRLWLFQVETLLNAIMNACNLYNMAPVMLGELLLFGTGAMSHVDDFDNVARFYTHTAGSYMLAQNDKFVIDTIVREFQMTARQLVAKFGKNVSTQVQNAYDRGNYESWFDVVHFVAPNENQDATKLDSKFKPFCAVYYEPGQIRGGPVLDDTGFDEFPAHCPRWDVTGEDVYATDCPGMTALGDTKGLQALERRTAQAIDKMVDPPMGGPPSLRNVAINSLPGGATLYQADGGQELKPLYTVQPQLQQHVLQISAHERRIKEAFYEDLFRSIDSMEGVQPQNQLFLQEKFSERLLQLGPVLERLHGEFLNRTIDRLFNQCMRAGQSPARPFGLLPPPPPEMHGQVLRTRYISSLAMAQRSVANASIDKFTMFIGGLVKMGFATAADNLNVDETIGIYGRNEGVSPKLILPPEAVAQARAQHAQQQAQQQRMEQMAMMAKAGGDAAAGANQLANAPTQTGGSILDNVANASTAAKAPPT